ncbi:hypothetical protein D6851_04395 [Altericroceibacterium spongiae]|uniref:Uncharacterized protein n=2 Tax=Altericroceibacterium spongiae TaxID=2320269 RepID=A0A420EQ02_9SPHN|nr:hypothetical protein D6851_04395 [Altericroceibacterium spongiae]
MPEAVRAFAGMLAAETGARAVLFYGSNLRTGSLDGVLDFYVLLPGAPESGIWPRVSYREWIFEGTPLRAKIATMTLAKFRQAAAGALIDTTIWARFVQPSALAFARDTDAAQDVAQAVADASVTAARLAAVLGPECGSAEDYWAALFRATYKAEFRVEKPGRERSILDANAAHFDGLLPLALDRAGIAWQCVGAEYRIDVPAAEQRRVRRWWSKRQRLGKALNLTRLVKASTTFDGAARYAAWKIERHTGVPVTITPWREKHPVLAAPGVLFSVWRRRGRQSGSRSRG